MSTDRSYLSFIKACPMSNVLLFNFTISLGAFFLLWLLSIRIKDVSIVDIFWGPALALPALLTWFLHDVAEPRSTLLVALVSIWAIRLAWYLARRNLGHGEDIRYAKQRAKAGGDRPFILKSLFSVFLLQCLISFFVSLPVQVGQFGYHAGLTDSETTLGVIAYVGIGLFVIGLFFEAVGDHQLKMFKKQPANKGKLMTQGVWAWTRHPNYFGDSLVWFGLTLIALEGAYGYWTILSPALMFYFLYFLSGKALTERMMARKYPEYAVYVKNVSGFLPRPPK